MHRLWDVAVGPVLEAVRPRTVVEIGSAGGHHTRLLAEYCRQADAVLHVIEPLPRYDPATFQVEFQESVVLHQARSLEALPKIPPADVALVDGDHNWYTVYNELTLLRDQARDAGCAMMPVVLCHDVLWPYGRRDLYYDPNGIPEEHRQPWRRAGILRGRPDLVPNDGLNAHLCNAEQEGGPHNGVMTAIEDFISETAESISLTVLPVIYGLGILVSRSRLERHPGLSRLLEWLVSVDGLRDLADLAERYRQLGDTHGQHMSKRLQQLSGRKARRDKAPRVGARRFSSELPPGVLETIQKGVLRTTYRGVPFLKSPFDVVLYIQLFQDLRPRTVVEVGSKAGGSALWFADMLANHGIHGRVVSVDIDQRAEVSDPRITFLQGDARDLAAALPAGVMRDLAHPMLVVEDSAHLYETTRAVLEFFDPHLRSGDYLVVEDGIVADLPGERYAAYENGPNRAVADFLDRFPDAYEIDNGLCDHYGYNFTYSPNAWLRKV